MQDLRLSHEQLDHNALPHEQLYKDREITISPKSKTNA